ncbi:hypothetical protein HPB51_004291 [Rhipicephalus microplus]|uniref:SUEL-type lectin domain-containing protein n=1 Tax=Rhipicephalus microplus TaxID=6941 RepID=A0A9J6EL37_RHIMP|nr:hypothetical protein HPB51_004291 [Rhipicephalus microplus]
MDENERAVTRETASAWEVSAVVCAEEAERAVLGCTAEDRGESQATNADPPRYRTAYACEGSQLRISCDEGHLVQLIRANYGRFSISICNEHGTLDWSVDCMSPRSFRVMQQSCDVKKGCTLPASTDVFGDPCPGTLKYLEAHYQCIPAELTTAGSVVVKPTLPTPGAAGDLLPPTLGPEKQDDRVAPRTPPPLPAVYQSPVDLSTTTDRAKISVFACLNHERTSSTSSEVMDTTTSPTVFSALKDRHGLERARKSEAIITGPDKN